MTFTPFQASPPVETPGPIEVLIEEARQKTRRRRTRYAFIALMILGVVVALVASDNFGRTVSRSLNVKIVSAVSPGLPRCNSSHLRVSSIGAPGGSMHDGVIVRIRNAGMDSCSLSGYPPVMGINHWNGRVLKGSTTRNSYLGGWDSSKPLPTVALRRKTGVASFLVTGVDAAIDNPSCPNLTTLRVTIPPSATVFKLSTSLNACRGGFQVHPFVPGATGTSQ
jgi:hypothetical protein